MKRFAYFFLSLFALGVFNSCSNSQAAPGADSTATGMDTVKSQAAAGSTAGFKLGVQMWTFRVFTFTEALDKVDSSGIKNIEAFIGQKLGGDMTGSFGFSIPEESRVKMKKLLEKKGIHMIALGVIVPKDQAEWIKTFELAKEFGLSYITCEPIKSQWDMVDSLAGVYNIPVAIHDHPKPNMYWSPDSVLAAIKGHPHIGSCADLGHWARNGLNPVECLKKLEGHIIGVHLKDIVKFDDPKAADTIVSKGVIDFLPILAELKRQNFNGMMSIEHESNWYHNLPDVIFTRIYCDSLVASIK